ncbi:MAG TPA: hypothetical protein VMZ29_04020 [Candidatus Bathyarchaeia archaeon]|nr:hypothetical protein [Candidatus Bathyarchaeia archaeon]
MNKRMKGMIFSLLSILILANIFSTSLIAGQITYEEFHYGYKSDSVKVVYWGGDQEEGSVYSAVDSNGNLGIVCFSESFNTSKDIYIVKFDSNVKEAWNASWSIADDATPAGIAIDSAGSIFVAGTVLTELDPSGFIHNVFVVKYNSSGSFRWATIHETENLEEIATGMVMDASGNVLVSGYTNSSSGGMFIQKYNRNGVYQDTYYFGNTAPHEGLISAGVTIDSKANLYISASTNNTPTGNFQDLILVKMNSTNGDIYWNTTFGGISNNDQGIDIAFSDDVAYLVGSIGDVSNPLDGVLVKINATTGGIIWDTIIDFDNDTISGISINRHGNPVITGSVNYGANSDFFTVEVNQTGYVLWNNTYEQTGLDISSDIICSGDFAFVVGKAYNSTDGYDNIMILVYEDDYEFDFPTTGPYGRIFGIIFGILIIALSLVFIFGIIFTYYKKR